MSLSNPSDVAEVAKGLRAREDQQIKLNDYSEIDSVSSNLNLLQGELAITAMLKNPSDIETPAFPLVEIIIDGTLEVISKNVEKIKGKSSLLFGHTIADLDPFLIMEKSEIAGTVQVKLAGKIVDKARFSSRITENKDSLLAKYFHGLATKANQSTGKVNVKERLTDVIAKIDRSLDNDLSNYVVKWKRQAQVNNTIIGDLQKEYVAANANNEISSESQEQYDRLAKMLSKKVNNKGSMRIRGLDKHFLKALKVISPSLSTKWRDHK
jgi:hypothetical protein